MLQLKDVVKTYEEGELKQVALKGVSLSFRDNEFVAVLGHSGSGKTTMLNILGGLDRYTSGDLIINGVSTKEFTDSDWDIYRNDKIGFVFQSYNLIPHQTVLANVEMALTLSGVPKKERQERAIKVLEKVGLKEHMNKRPNQLSGGQMQRVAIARALINNPHILLADEPTGALDSETSIQIMDLLKEIAKDRLVIMVTHNPELAEKYATRVVRLMDGKIISDSDPYEEKDEKAKPEKKKRVSMSFATALSLSFNNLRTKKGRTLLTAFAGSIGIIGIAIILGLSTGMNAYIDNVQKETMTAYPVVIGDEIVDMSGLMGMHAEVVGEMMDSFSDKEVSDGVHANYRTIKATDAINSSIIENNLTDFKKYLDDPNSEIHQYLGENGVVYGYDVKFSVFSHNKDGKFIDSDSEVIEDNLYNAMDPMGMYGGAMIGIGQEDASNFSQLMSGPNGEVVSPVIKDSYQLIHGNWPEKADEAVLILDKHNSIPAGALYQLGLITKEEYDGISESIKNGEEVKEIILDYEDVCKHEFSVVPACDRYKEDENGRFTFIDDPILNEEEILKNSVPLKIVGIIRPEEGADNANILTAVGYTGLLTDYLIQHTEESPVVVKQKENPHRNVLNGVNFEASTEEDKVNDAIDYLFELRPSEKAGIYKMIMYLGSKQEKEGKEVPSPEMSGMALSAMNSGDESMAAMLDWWLSHDPDKDALLGIYDQYIGDTSYKDNLELFGNVSYDTPYTISLYTDDFESKDAIAKCIENYNETVDEDGKISYTDYVAMMTSSLTTIINGISYVLVAFVAVSLIVSCIMIGIITHISVMERTKEIGILRALGASKSNISQVFNAETFIVGCCAGVLGIGLSLLSFIPINSLIAKSTGIANLGAQLPIGYALILIVISIVITILGGLIPAKNAAKKDPVVALRTE